MIYDFPDEKAPIRQGDLFRTLPRVDISLNAIQAFKANDEVSEQSWDALVKSKGGKVEAVLSITPVFGIVISQDCDTERAEDLSLCEVRDFGDVFPLAKDGDKTPKWWMKFVTGEARRNPKWFYLPPNARVFENRNAVDFFATFRLSRNDLNSYRRYRIATLNPVARLHFRERISEFFRRYPYDEWYPLNPEEFKEYRSQKHYEDAKPFPWQE